MSTDATFNALVDTRVPNPPSVFTSTKIDDAVTAAVAFWSKHRPQVLVTDLAGDGSTYDFSLPADFDIHTSYVKTVEYPAGNRDPDYLNEDAWTIYRDDSTAYLRLFDDTPLTGEEVRMTYTTLHVVDGSGSTIDANDENALADLAAAILCEWISTYYSDSTDSSLVVDSADHKSRAAEYAMRAKRYRQLALDHLGIGAGGKDSITAGSVAAAGLQKDFDTVRYDGSIRLTHPQR